MYGLSGSILFFLDLLVIIREYRGTVIVNAVSLVVAICVMNAMFSRFFLNGISFTLIVAFGLNITLSLILIFSKARKNAKFRVL